MPQFSQQQVLEMALKFPVAAIFGLTLHAILLDPEWATVDRDLSVVEIFTVAQALVLAARAAHLKAEPFDLALGSPDILTKLGFYAAVRLVLRAKAGGLVLLAPCCSSWGFPCSAQTQRKKSKPAGDKHNAKVVQANLMARISIFLYCLAVLRGASAIFENPERSMIFQYGP